MKLLKKALVILILPLFAFTAVHKFYLSVTNIEYSDKDGALQITSRVFLDDISMVLEERYGIKYELVENNASDLDKMYLEKYFKTKFEISLNGKIADYTFLGSQKEEDMLVCYIEVPNVNLPQIQSIQVQNDVLTDLFDEQQNVVHFKLNGKKKSFILIKENNKGMLNF